MLLALPSSLLTVSAHLGADMNDISARDIILVYYIVHISNWVASQFPLWYVYDILFYVSTFYIEPFQLFLYRLYAISTKWNSHKEKDILDRYKRNCHWRSNIAPLVVETAPYILFSPRKVRYRKYFFSNIACSIFLTLLCCIMVDQYAMNVRVSNRSAFLSKEEWEKKVSTVNTIFEFPSTYCRKTERYLRTLSHFVVFLLWCGKQYTVRLCGITTQR